MAALLTKFVYYDNLNLDPSDGIGTEILDATSITIDSGSELKNNTLRITVSNPPVNIFSDGTIQHQWVNDDGDAIFKAIKTSRGQVIEEEIIEVYAAYTETDASIDVESNDYLLFIGVINAGKIPFKPSSHNIELDCKDRSVIILDKLTIPQAYKPDDTRAPGGVGWKSPTIVQALLRNSTESDNVVSKFDNNGNESVNGIYLVDARLFSDSIEKSGTNTSASTRKLIDGSATFLSDDIEKDDWVRNTTTNEYAYIASIDDNNTITLSKDIFTASGTGYQISDGFIQDIRGDGTSFPVTSFSQLNKPVTEGIEDLSSTQNTNTSDELETTYVVKRSMRWFIDKMNRFHWYIPSDTPEYVMEVGQISAISPDTKNHIIYDASPETFVDDNINFIIFKAGEDMNGIQIKSYSRAAFSGTPNVKDSLREWPRIARQMKWADENAGNIVKDEFDKYSYPTSYNPLSSGNYYPAWDTTRSSIPTDASGYNTAFKLEAIKRGKSQAQKEFRKFSNPRWKGKIQLRGEPINVGDLIDFTSKEHGINNILVRVTQVTHSIESQSGWITTINFEEDENETEVIS